MVDQSLSDEEFETTYQSTLRELTSQHRKDTQMESWSFVEEVRGNTGADGYYPEWLLPYASFISQITGVSQIPSGAGDGPAQMLRAALLRAAQLGFTEGYFAGKDD